MRCKAFPVLGLIVAGTLAIAGRMIFWQPDQPETAPPEAAALPALETLPSAPAPLAQAPEPADHPSSPVDAAASALDLSPPAPTQVPSPGSNSDGKPTRLRNAQKPRPASAPPRTPKPPLQDPTARVAMSFVGADPDAAAYWLEAIFDPGLPDQEREDLMEDLNEEGLSDHKQPGPEDFPLIMNRLALIEAIAPEADEFMLPHLREAYQDLVNLAEITQGGGSPVQ